MENIYLWNPEYRKIWHVASGILGSGIQNTAQGIQNPTNNNWIHWQDWQRLESSTWNPESIVWNPESKTALDPLTWGER